jgi:outer membrane immunogenic protein
MRDVFKWLVVGYGLSSIAYAGTMASTSKKLDGFFIGAYVGAGWNQNTSFQTSVLNASAPYFNTTATINSVQKNGSTGTAFSVPVGGGQAGILKRAQNIVYGVVADYGVFNFSPSYSINNVTYPSSANTYNFSTQFSSNWLFTTRGRLSYVFDEHLPLIYGSGGLAVSEIQVSNHFTDNTAALGVGNSTSQKTVAGFTFGGGVEYLLSEHFLVNVEYLYINLPSVNTVAYASSTNSVNYTMSPLETAVGLTANIMRVGINYKL